MVKKKKNKTKQKKLYSYKLFLSSFEIQISQPLLSFTTQKHLFSDLGVTLQKHNH